MKTDKLSWKVERSLTRLTTPVLLTTVTPTDRSKSVYSRCVIEDFGGVFYVDITPIFDRY